MQRLVHDSDARFRVVAAGARAGKSLLAGAEIAYSLLQPGHRIWIVASQYELAEREFVWALDLLANYKNSLGISFTNYCKISTAARGSREIRSPYGSFCKTKSTEKMPSLLGEELDLLVIGESAKLSREAWERYLRARLGSRCGRLLATSTPDSDSGIFTEFFRNGQTGVTGWESWQFSTLDNPTFSRDEWETAKRSLDKDVFAEQYEGKFVSRRGLVFRTFQDVHISNELPAGVENWPVVRGLQKGFQNPFCCVWIAIDPGSKNYFVYRDYSKVQVLPEDALREIEELSRGRHVIGTIIDYWDGDFQTTCRQSGIGITVQDEKKIGHNAAIVKRVQAIQNLLKDTGSSKLRIHSSCQAVIEDLKKCKWPERQPEEKEKAEVEIPSSKYFQCAAALSYAVAFLESAKGVDVYGSQQKRH